MSLPVEIWATILAKCTPRSAARLIMASPEVARGLREELGDRKLRIEHLLDGDAKDTCYTCEGRCKFLTIPGMSTHLLAIAVVSPDGNVIETTTALACILRSDGVFVLNNITRGLFTHIHEPILCGYLRALIGNTISL